MKWKIQNLHNGIPAGEWDFPNDTMVLYEGLYGAPRCFVWYADVDKSSMLDVSPIMRVAFDQNGDTVFWDDFSLQRSYFNASSGKFVVYAESEIFVRLNKSTDQSHKIFSSNPSKPKNPIDVLEELLSSLLVPVGLIVEDGLSGNIGYTQFSFDESTSVMDVISKICRDNQWEWFLDHDRLIVGETIDFTGGSFPFGDEAEILRAGLPDSAMKTIVKEPFENVTMPARSIQPGAGYKNKKRVLWVKYYMGEKYGDIMTFLALRKRLGRIGPGQYEKKIPDRTIRENHNKWYNSMMSGGSPIMMGKCVNEPENDSTFREEYRMPEFAGDIKQMAKKHEDMMFEEKYKQRSKQDYVLSPKMTTPYAGDGQGLLFPQSKTNKVLFTPRVGRELSLAGPSYFGDEMEVPKRDDALDFRLQLPDGGVIYNKNGQGTYYIHPDMVNLTIGDMGSDSTSIPSNGADILMDSDGIMISMGGSTVEITNNGIEIEGNQVQNLKPTLKISQGQVQVKGTLKADIIDATLIKGSTVNNSSGPMAKKLIPG